MNIEAKKKSIIGLIKSVTDENVIDEINAKVVNLIPKDNNENLNKFRVRVLEKFDLDLIKDQQNYNSPTIEEINDLIDEADIQEPIDELLNMI